ncbi:hypothetical protein NKI72_31245 [Mesorhizobium sp. M0437]|uniref:hypothetical protein n=1 Tax=Mesorhizobium sp. M0437 TaxID=2956945 RepID=UPI00333828FD
MTNKISDAATTKQSADLTTGSDFREKFEVITTQSALLDFLERRLDEAESRIIVSESTREIFDLIKGSCGEEYDVLGLSNLDVVRALADGIVDDRMVITSHMMLAFIFKFLGVHSEESVDSLTAIELMIDHAFPAGWVNVEDGGGETRILTTRTGKQALGLRVEVTIPHPPRRPADPMICEMFFDWPEAFERLRARTPAEVADRRAAEVAERVRKHEEKYGPILEPTTEPNEAVDWLGEED